MRHAHSRTGSWSALAGRLRWGTQEPPTPGPDEILVKVAFAGVCGSDLAKLNRSPIAVPERRWCPGHEVTGWDLERSSARPVVIDPLIPCDDCVRCSRGETHLCPELRRLGWDLPGGFAHFLTVPRTAVTELPEEADLAYGVLADPLAVAIHGLRCALPPTFGGRLAVIGSGAVAICTAAYAVHLGWHVSLMVRDMSRVAVLQGKLDDATLGLVGAFPNSHFDAVVDAASGRDAQPLDSALTLVRDGGHVVVQNAYEPGVRLGRDLREVFRRSLTITGSFSFCRRDGHDFAEALHLLAARPEWAAALTRDRYPLHELPEVLERMRTCDSDRPLKAVLTTEGAIAS
ncbi:alcohol dehydrogenase catalytic domain-containing protein [Nocardiopsis sp. NPDC007018]|uniref:zinc-dependent alcohol dehydrogenase n=1 Tax=Nocardiopsis sp. NPDC007018 TaxID=3155721 RepID=UPI003411E444